MLKPIKNHIVFEFLDDIDNGMFTRKSAAGIVILGHHADSAKSPRWAKVYACGPDVSEEDLRGNGVQILIDTLKWTPSFKYQGTKLWRTDETHVIGYTLPEDRTSDHPDLMFVS